MPIVARVMVGTAVLHADPRAWLEREIDVGAFLAATGAPIVPPATAVDPGPHISGGLWLSFWEYAEVVPVALTAGEIGGSLRSLHEELARYPGALPPQSRMLEEIDWLLAALAAHADTAALHEERDRLAPLLRSGDAGGQPLHGDASLSNLLSTSAGPRWNDFEGVSFGSPAWDVVGLVDDAREHYGEAFAADVLTAYGRAVDPALTDLVRDAYTLYGTLWRRYRRTTPAVSPTAAARSPNTST